MYDDDLNDTDELAAHLRDAGEVVNCDLCGNMGNQFSWPFVQWRDLSRYEGNQAGDGIVLCDECWADAYETIKHEAERSGGDGQR